MKETIIQKAEPKKTIAEYYTGSNTSPGIWQRLKPTGRWQIERYDNEAIMYVEHKGLIFRKWVHESDIRFVERHVPEIVIIECEKRGTH